MSILAIDGDSLIYKACFICQKSVYDILPKGYFRNQLEPASFTQYQPFLIQTFRYVKEYKEWLKEHNKTEDDFIRVVRVEMEPLSQAFWIISEMLKDMIRAEQPEQVIIYLTGVNNFREKLAQMRGYKESRKGREKPLYFQPVKEFLITKWNAVVVDGYEADDAVSILQYSCLQDDQICTIATIDKDLQTVPGWNYNYDSKKKMFITPFQASYNFYKQMLMGDKSDDIVGVPGIGEKRAKALLDTAKTAEELFQIVAGEYERAFGLKDDKIGRKFSKKVSNKVLLENGQLLHMLRHKNDMWQCLGA